MTDHWCRRADSWSSALSDWPLKNKGRFLVPKILEIYGRFQNTAWGCISFLSIPVVKHWDQGPLQNSVSLGHIVPKGIQSWNPCPGAWYQEGRHGAEATAVAHSHPDPQTRSRKKTLAMRKAFWNLLSCLQEHTPHKQGHTHFPNWGWNKLFHQRGPSIQTYYHIWAILIQTTTEPAISIS